jgi:septum formation protein
MLVLASQSPRRREILERAGVPFVVRVSVIPELRQHAETAIEYVRRLARLKAEAIDLEPENIALGADTVVVLDEHVLEKPTDAGDARRMLTLLSGREHSVITGICLRHANGFISDHAETRVHFAELDAGEIDAYVDTGEPLDKAGAYAIQGYASKHIHRIEGCYFNVVGLPIALIYRHLKDIPELSKYQN